MKEATQWQNPCPISSDDSSDSDSDNNRPSAKKPTIRNEDLSTTKPAMSEVAKSRLKKRGGMDFEALSKYGYKGGPSVLKVPPPKVEEKQDWTWSTGKQDEESKKPEESYEEREQTRAAAQGEKLLDVQINIQQSRIDKKNISFSQKEKRKRDLGQASRGKNYVEEEKRLLRENGVYSGFDS